MVCCTKRCQQYTTFIVAALLILLGTLLAIFWNGLVKKITKHELSLSNRNTKGYEMWKETPIPMELEFYFFNWTNSDEVIKSKWTKNPKFVEMGPYVYSEHHIREDVIFNDNNTITYKTKKIWKFIPEKSNGSLTDQITSINVILAVLAKILRTKHIIVRKAVNFIIKEKNEQLVITKSVDEYIFSGYEDPFIKLARKLNITGLDIPFDKFGWFYQRNGSVDYDGVFNMYNGQDDIQKLGRFKMWNYTPKTKYYPGECGRVKGTSGELWYPPKEDKKITVFSPDMCSSVDLTRNGTDELYGIKGYKYLGTKDVFDNGDLDPSKKCYVPEGESLKSGVRSVSKCKFNAPAYLSYPHFYMADESYRAGIEGMNPDPAKHTAHISLEPNVGLPLSVYACFQVNILLYQVPGISLLENVKPTYFPMIWFSQKAELTEDLASQVKILLILPEIGNYTAYGIIGIGSIVLICAFYILRSQWNKVSEEEHLIS